MKRRIGVAVMAAVVLCGCNRNKEATEVRLAIGGAEQMIYLPATLAQHLGYYEAEGVRVRVENLAGVRNRCRRSWAAAPTWYADFTITRCKWRRRAGGSKPLRSCCIIRAWRSWWRRKNPGRFGVWKTSRER